MLKTRNNHTEVGQTLPFLPFTANYALQAFQPLMSERVCNSCLEMNQYWIKFLGKRFEEDAALMHKLVLYTGSLQVFSFSIFTEFVQKAITDYSREFADMTRLGQAWLTDAARSAQQATGANGRLTSEQTRGTS
jgi:hypothetical protein